MGSYNMPLNSLRLSSSCPLEASSHRVAFQLTLVATRNKADVAPGCQVLWETTQPAVKDSLLYDRLYSIKGIVVGASILFDLFFFKLIE